MPVIAALDAPHPKQDVTQRNAGASLLLKIPLETRLMIYEFAVAVDRPITPIQMGKGSNKFARASNYWGAALPSSNLTVTDLARTCRMVYHDLEAKPVFYRTNSFHFKEIGPLHSFLAAITPERRSSIRQIEATKSGHIYEYNDYGFSGWNDFGKVMPLLLQCHDLRQLSIRITNNDVSDDPSHLTRRVGGSLDRCLGLMTETPYDDTNSIINAPGFQLILDLKFDATYWPRNQFSRIDHNLTIGPDWNSDELQGNLATNVRKGFAVQIAKIGEAMASRKAFLNKHDIAKTVKSGQVKRSIGAAGVHFPGEERIHLNRLDSDIGSISSRTRHRCNTANINTATGSIERTVGKHDSQGVLICDNWTILDIRVVDSEIECQVSIGWGGPTSWEPLHTVTTPHGIRELTKVYRGHLYSVATFEEVVQSLPLPRDIAPLMNIYDTGDKLDKKSLAVYQREWAKLQERYETRMEQLASRNNQKASKAQQTAKKTKNTPQSTKRG
ncbi:hypothetical protein PG991_003899 [Apiospora marii]|uniref:Uncharacterized protein n=1 Tax=Apiospora marii TaxID=335849 RepID=A0ABR1S4R7_9PEZI